MKYLLSFAFIFLCNFSFCQQGIKGSIVDDQTGEALIAASIATKFSGTYTEVDGTFILELQPGEHVVEISYIGFETETQTILIENGQYQQVVYSLTASKLLLETATITGSKYERSIAKAPVSISVISQDFLESNNTSNVETILDKVPGVQMIDGQANIRGGSGFSYGAGSRVMLLVDEIPGLQVDSGLANWGDIPTENISQVEIIKGASSVLYGSSAMNGIIHIRTGYATSEPETKLNVAYNYFMAPEDAKKQWWDTAPSNIVVSGVHKRKIGKLDLVFNGFYNDESKFYSTDNGTIDSSDDEPMQENKIRGGVKMRYRLNDQLSFSLNATLTRINSASPFLWKNPTSGAYENFSGAITEGIKTRFFIDPTVKYYDRNGGKHQLLTRQYSTNNDQNNNQSNSSFSNYFEYQYQKKFNEIGLLSTTGVSTQLVNSDSALFGDTTFFSRNLALYTQIEKEFFEKLNVLAGVRLESNVQVSPEEFMGFVIPEGRDEDSKFIARGALNYQISKFSFLRASLGQGYRYPTITERFITTSFGGLNIFSNPFLKPETGWSSEIGFKQGYKLGPINGFVDVAGFWSQYDNMMEFTFATVNGAVGFRSENVGDIDIKGIELNAEGVTTVSDFKIAFLAGYSFINPIYRNFEGNDDLQSSLSSSKVLVDGSLVDAEAINILKYRSRHNVKADVQIGYKDLLMGVNLTRVSHAENVDLLLANFAGIREYRSINQDGYLTLDARISYQLKLVGVDSKFSIVGKNILNEEYTVRPGLLEAPRNFAVRLDVSF